MLVSEILAIKGKVLFTIGPNRPIAEAVEIMKEIEELQKIAASLMQRQKKVMEAIGRIKGFADGGSQNLVAGIPK